MNYRKTGNLFIIFSGNTKGDTLSDVAFWWWRKGNVNRIFVILIHRVDIAYSLVNASGSILYYFIDAEKFITIFCFHKSNSVCVIRSSY